MVATAIVAVARLGGQAGFVSTVGDDETGQWIVRDFEGYGIDVSRMVVQRGAASHRTVVLVDGRTGARSFLSDRGTVGEPQPEDLDRAYLTGATILHLSDAGPGALRAARWAKEAGTEVCFDGTHFLPSVLPLVPMIDYLIVSRFFASEYMAYRDGQGIGKYAADFAALAQDDQTKQHVEAMHPSETVPALGGRALLAAAEHLRDLGPGVVVVTEGEEGSWCASDEGSFHVPAYPTKSVVDTTGAGDVFHGGFLYARSRGWELERALRLASASASLKCRALGGRAGIPTLPEALQAAGLEG